MNNLDATLTKVEVPVWDEKYQTWRVQVEYNCWGGAYQQYGEVVQIRGVCARLKGWRYHYRITQTPPPASARK